MKSNHICAWLNIVVVFGLLVLMDVSAMPTWVLFAIGVIAGAVAGEVATRLIDADPNERR